MRDATVYIIMRMVEIIISTHAPHAGRDKYHYVCRQSEQISTHAPHAGRDLAKDTSNYIDGISTHAPHAGRDSDYVLYAVWQKDFYSRAPCGTRHSAVYDSSGQIEISTHAPHAGRDKTMQGAYGNGDAFLLTRPMRDATIAYGASKRLSSHFYSRAPCGTRLMLILY